MGLSWPNLAAALGREPPVSAKRWLVLYWGSGPKGPVSADRALWILDRKGAPVEAETSEIEGIVLLDGTWSQAKSLWWRNAWLLKLRRGILLPGRPSLYGRRRREPRRECVSTIEAIAETLVLLGEKPETGDALRSEFAAFLSARD